MRVLIRYFFRTLRLLLTPLMLLAEKLSTPKAAVSRSAEAQAEVDRQCRSLALYQFRACPFCVKVRKEMARLDLSIELRDAQLDPDHRQALLEGGGRVKVPCLRIEQADGSVDWLYESDAINAWLRERFGALEAEPQQG
ncbi:glutaredoxin family protein [Halomonas sp. 328]|uniref:glutaredoxin family protein n=1 Tax=Halomonas sp. 328 TaxID=2776704 RepID=UPI0018A7315C|nr:glutathione S-transferase N-terminal domain-containing protein [Halomonas sp. 328]MBF8223946.1 glutathione S-transferase N-terminal domain-containing protein [Halomonas sp. 328]